MVVQVLELCPHHSELAVVAAGATVVVEGRVVDDVPGEPVDPCVVLGHVELGPEVLNLLLGHPLPGDHREMVNDTVAHERGADLNHVVGRRRVGVVVQVVGPQLIGI